MNLKMIEWEGLYLARQDLVLRLLSRLALNTEVAYPPPLPRYVKLIFELDTKGDVVLMKKLKSYFKCGICYTNQGGFEKFNVVKLYDILEIII